MLDMRDVEWTTQLSSGVSTGVGIPHIKYSGDEALLTLDNKVYTNYVCWSENFLSDGLSKMTLESLCKIMGLDMSKPVENFKALDLWNDYCYYCLLDFLIINRDRHGANIEVLIDNENKLKTVPPFDNGLCLIAPYQDDLKRASKIDYMENFKGNSCLVTDRSLYTGLKNIGHTDIILNKITKDLLYDNLFDDVMLKYLPHEEYAEIIVDILWERYSYAEREKIFTAK